MTITVGQPVVFETENGQTFVAVVVDIHDSPDGEPTLDLDVIPPGTGLPAPPGAGTESPQPYRVTEVLYNDSGQPGTWHLPPRPQMPERSTQESITPKGAK